ncbi:NAD(P)-binding protein [Mucilaginibacter endophyticus]|uniref:NAD(P)-binding protein n=1 Tax=Mucilaginibacter endophyticus TaxID=2675003 RepID=UPI001ABF9F6C
MKNCTPQKHLVIVGGGFAGLNLAQHLINDKKFRITLIDKNNYNYSPPCFIRLQLHF